MIRYLKLIIVAIFGLIAFKTIQNATGQADGLGVWFLPLALGLIFIPLTYYIIKILKTKQ
jgi:hydrogenase-4 membrane subunit HyfE